MSDDDKVKRRVPKWMVGVAGAGLLAGGLFTTSALMNNRPGAAPAPTAMNATLWNQAHGGQKVPPVMQRIASLETQLANAGADPDLQALLRSQIRCEQYMGIRDKTLPADYQKAVLDEIEPEYRAMRAQADSTRRSAEIRDAVGRKLNDAENATGLPLPDVSGAHYWGKYNDISDRLDLPHAIVLVSRHTGPIGDVGELAHINRGMDGLHATNQQTLDTLNALQAVASMAGKGPLTVTGDENLIKGLQTGSGNPRDWGVPHSLHNQSKANRTKVIGAINIKAADGQEIDLPLPVSSLSMISNMPAVQAARLQVANHEQSLKLDEAATKAFQSVNPGQTR